MSQTIACIILALGSIYLFCHMLYKVIFVPMIINTGKKRARDRVKILKDKVYELKAENTIILKMYFEKGPHSEWGIKNRCRIDCLKISIKHFESDLEEKDPDLEFTERMENNFGMILKRINEIKEGGS